MDNKQQGKQESWMRIFRIQGFVQVGFPSLGVKNRNQGHLFCKKLRNHLFNTILCIVRVAVIFVQKNHWYVVGELESGR